MNVLFLSNNLEVTRPIYDWLCEIEGVENIRIWDRHLNTKLFQNDLSGTEFIISYNYQYVITNDVIALFPNHIINLHISLLPWNRGISPNLWSFINDTPKGVTIHLVDEGIDTGEILIQQQLFFNENIETLSSSYHKLHVAIQKLFKENWDFIKRDQIILKKQGSINTRKETEKILRMYKISWNDNIFDVKQRVNDNHKRR